MTPQELLTVFRDTTRDTVAPFLWAESEIYMYMAHAQQELVRAVGGIADSRSDLTQVTLQAGRSYYPLSHKILKITTAYWDDTGKELTLYNEENLPPRGRTLRDAVGTPDALIIGMDAGYMRIDPVPDEAADGGVIRLVVYRLPIKPLLGESGCETPGFEVAEQHHLHLLAGMLGQAYKKQDAETFNGSSAKASTEEFMQYCDRAKREKERREHRPRVVSYGGL